MPLVAIPLALPPDAVALRTADVDADGREELVVESRPNRSDRAVSVTVTVVHFDGAGREEGRDTLSLGTQALAWDMALGGIYGLDGQGALQLFPTRTRLADLDTPLAWVGPTTPRALDIVHDLDGDGDAEILVWSRGKVHAVASHGGVYGSFSAPAEGKLATESRAGATGMAVTALFPRMVVGDIDGDGTADVALPKGRSLTVHFTGDALAARTASLRLPRDLAPPPERGAQAQTGRRLINTWFADLDGDGKLDLLTQEALLSGGWFGSTAALTLYRGTGAGFSAGQTVQTAAAALDVQTLDWEGDGDLDLLVPMIDVTVGNLARGLLARKVSLDAWLFPMADGRLATTPVRVGALDLPLNNPDALHAELTADVTGDGVVDLVTDEGADRVVVYAGQADPTRGRGLSSTPVARLDLPVADVDGALRVVDLTGDGRAEVVVWEPGQTQAQVLRLVD